MSLEDHKEMSRRALGMWGSDNTCRAEDILEDNCVNHQEPDVEGGVSSKSLEAWGMEKIGQRLSQVFF